MEVHDRIVHEGEPRLALPGEIPHELRFPVEAHVQDRLGPAAATSAIASPSGRSSAAPRTISISSSTEIARSAKRSPGWSRSRVVQGGEVLLGELGREDLARAVGQVVGLVDEEDRVGELLAASGGAARRPARRRSCSRRRSRRRGRRARAGPRRGRLPRGAPPRRRSRGPRARGPRAGARASPDAVHLLAGSPWRSGRTPRGRGSDRSRTFAPSRGPGPS